MKKLGILHIGIVVLIVVSFVYLILGWTPEAKGADRRENPYRSEQVYKRRQRILNNGNINSYYKQPVRIEWVFVNGRARMALFFNR